MTQQATSAPETTKPVKQPWDRVFFVAWVLMTTISLPIAEILAPEAGNLIRGPFGKWLPPFITALFLLDISNDTLKSISYVTAHAFAGLCAGLTAGFIIALAQWLVLRLRFKRMFFWFIYTFILYGVIDMVVSGVGSVVTAFGGLALLIFLFFVEAPLTGLGMGIGQWLLLRRQLRNSVLWILVTWVSEITGNLTVVFNDLFRITIFDTDSSQWLLGDLVLVVFAFIFGLATGAVLTWLMSKDARFAKFVTLE